MCKTMFFHQNGRGWVGSRAGSLPIGLVMEDSKAVGEARGNPPLFAGWPFFSTNPSKKGGMASPQTVIRGLVFG